MKLLRYGDPGQERPGILDSAGRIRDLGGIVGDIGPALLADPRPLAGLDIDSLPLVEGSPRLGPCVAGARGGPPAAEGTNPRRPP